MNASHIYILLFIPPFDKESTVDSFVWTGLWDLWYFVFQTLTSPSGHRQRKDSPSIEAASQSRYDVSTVLSVDIIGIVNNSSYCPQILMFENPFLCWIFSHSKQISAYILNCLLEIEIVLLSKN